MGIGAFPDARLFEYVLGFARGRRVLVDGTATPDYDGPPLDLPGELDPLLVLAVAAGEPAGARALPRRDPRLRREHGEHARGLAGARLRPDPARGLGVGGRPLRLERGDDLLVRGRGDGLVQSSASTGCATVSASSRGAPVPTTTARSGGGPSTRASSRKASRPARARRRRRRALRGHGARRGRRLRAGRARLPRRAGGETPLETRVLA